MDIHIEPLNKLEKFNNRLEFFVRDYQKMRKMLDQRDALLVKRDSEITRLREKCGEETNADDDSVEYTFEELMVKAKAALEIDYGWQTEYEKQSGFSHSILEGWKSDGLVPAQAMVACEILKPAEKKKRIDWKFNPALGNMVYDLYCKNISYSDIAERMKIDYPQYEWTHNTIAGQLRKSRSAERRFKSNP